MGHVIRIASFIHIEDSKMSTFHDLLVKEVTESCLNDWNIVVDEHLKFIIELHSSCLVGVCFFSLFVVLVEFLCSNHDVIAIFFFFSSLIYSFIQTTFCCIVFCRVEYVRGRAKVVIIVSRSLRTRYVHGRPAHRYGGRMSELLFIFGVHVLQLVFSIQCWDSVLQEPKSEFRDYDQEEDPNAIFTNDSSTINYGLNNE